MDHKPRARVAIVGAGIGGLTLAVAIGRLDRNKDIEIHIYEASPKLEEIGAGLTIWHRTWELLKTLGCQESLNGRALPVSRPDSDGNHVVFQFRKSDQKDGFTFLNLTLPGGTWSIHRADLQKTLLERLTENTHIHLCSRVIAFEEHSSAATLKFEDGRTASFDLIVGADGLRSIIRKGLLTAKFPNERDRIDPIWSGSVIYRFIIPKETMEQKVPGHPAIETPIMYCGKSKHIVTYPISMGRYINVGAFYSNPEQEGNPFPGNPVQETSREELLQHYEGWEDDAVKLIECVDKPLRWAVLTSKPLSAYGSGRIALLGDAAHPMTPHLGSGAGQAMEDAYVLASVMTMGVRNGTNISRMIETYSTVRQPMGNFVLNGSRRQGLRYEFNSPGLEDLQEKEPVQMDRMTKLAEEISQDWKWIWNTSVQEDQRRAIARL